MPIPRAAKDLVPSQLRAARYKLRRLGPAGFARYRRLERAAARKPAPRAGEPFDIGGGTIVLHDSTVWSVRSHWVEYGHGIEELSAFKRLAPRHRAFLDIGAAEGIFSAAFCSLTGRPAWAFEPSPEMFGRLRHLCHLNPTFAIKATNIALGAASGQRQVKQYADGQFSGVGAASGQSEVMTMTTLDAFVSHHGIEPDFAKIDVEGMEIEVLKGGEQTFRGSVLTIVLEVHYDMLEQANQSMAELQGLLEAFGFYLESLDGSVIGDLASFARKHPELQPGYTIIVCRKSRTPTSDALFS